MKYTSFGLPHTMIHCLTESPYIPTRRRANFVANETCLPLRAVLERSDRRIYSILNRYHSRCDFPSKSRTSIRYLLCGRCSAREPCTHPAASFVWRLSACILSLKLMCSFHLTTFLFTKLVPPKFTPLAQLRWASLMRNH